MLDIKQNIINLLKPLLIYDLEEGSWDDKEISVCSQFLQDLSDRTDELLREIFVQTAEGCGLVLKSKLLNLSFEENPKIKESPEIQENLGEQESGEEIEVCKKIPEKESEESEEELEDKARDKKQKIRQRILSLISTNQKHFNKTDIVKFLSSMGFDCEIKENIADAQESILISFSSSGSSFGLGLGSSLSESESASNSKQVSFLKEQVTRMLPAHLDVVFDVGKETTWEDFEKLSFAQDQEFSWDAF